MTMPTRQKTPKMAMSPKTKLVKHSFRTLESMRRLLMLNSMLNLPNMTQTTMKFSLLQNSVDLSTISTEKSTALTLSLRSFTCSI